MAEYQDTQRSSPAPSKYIQKQKHMPLWKKSIVAFFSVIKFLIMTWLLSIAIEWIGMFFIWSDEGSGHSQRMLTKELGYLSDDFKVSVIGESPAVTAFETALFIKYYVFEWTNIILFFEWLQNTPADASNIRLILSSGALAANEYFLALINTSVIYTVRVTVATLSMPAFLLIGGAAFIDGLVQRELRIYRGGIERSWVYHHVKPWITPAIFTTWFFYLGIPVAIHPNLIFGPAIVIFGLSVFITTTLFKKHL